ncbi:hypothetical protein T31B1_18043 [Salinisphaera sp. T31B1]
MRESSTHNVFGLPRSGYAGCHEFFRRQRSVLLEIQRARADRFGDIEFELECCQPAALGEWKFPDSHSPVESMANMLDAARGVGAEDIYATLADATPA